MKKIIVLLSIAIFAITIFAFAAEDTKPELRPARKVMQARVAWLAAINKNLGAKNFEAVAKDANELSAQTKRVGENLTNPLGKELDLAISLLAKDVSAAAAKKNSDVVKVKLGEIKAKCGECHAKIRDKK
jgi:cytochrome c556